MLGKADWLGVWSLCIWYAVVTAYVRDLIRWGGWFGYEQGAFRFLVFHMELRGFLVCFGLVYLLGPLVLQSRVGCVGWTRF